MVNLGDDDFSMISIGRFMISLYCIRSFGGKAGPRYYTRFWVRRIHDFIIYIRSFDEKAGKNRSAPKFVILGDSLERVNWGEFTEGEFG